MGREGSGMNTWESVALVAGREIRTRVASRAFVVTTLVLVVAIVVGGVLVGTLAERSMPAQTVGVTSDTAPLAPALVSAGAASGTEIEVREVNDGEDQVRDGTLDALLTGSATEPRLLVRSDLSAPLSLATGILAQQLALDREIRSLGGDPAQVAQSLARAGLDVESLEPAQPVDPARAFTGMIGGILIFVAITITGQLVAQGVVEEKTSRVVELLLATIRPWQLMAGKVLGIGAIGLAQLALIGGAGALSATISGALAGTAIDLTATVAWIVVWFVVGYVMYSLVLAALAALVSRQEDVGTVIMPVVFTMMIPYFLGVTIGVQDPTNPLITNLSLVPFFSPFLMPIRIATGTVAGWELVLTLVLGLGVLPLLVWASGTVYGNAVLRTGARVSLREAMRRT
jgi:ABC-2 type transport system permease protein